MSYVIEICAKRILCTLQLLWLLLWLGCDEGQPQSEVQQSTKRLASDTTNTVVMESGTIERATTTNKAQQSSELPRTEPLMNQDSGVVKAVRDWYASKEAIIPSGITIRERNSNYWTVVATPGLPTEMWFQVDPKSNVILRAVGD